MLCTLFLIHLHSLLTGTDNEHPNSYIILALAECTVSAASPCVSWRGSLPLLARISLPSVRLLATGRRCKVKVLKTTRRRCPCKWSFRLPNAHWRQVLSQPGASCHRDANTDTAQQTANAIAIQECISPSAMYVADNSKSPALC
ncbi:hypothetical protein DFH06DRAFT_332722 [Mycena polygramma]|nr:hypothetical protein DFH06DRAFT_332722 [Mycena polygramma]